MQTREERQRHLSSDGGEGLGLTTKRVVEESKGEHPGQPLRSSSRLDPRSQSRFGAEVQLRGTAGLVWDGKDFDQDEQVQREVGFETER